MMTWYYRLGIRAKLQLGFGLVIALTLLITGAAVSSMSNARNAAAEIQWTLEERYALYEQQLQDLMDIESSFGVLLSNYSKDKSLFPAFEAKINDFSNKLQSVTSVRHPQEVAAIKDSTAKYLEVYNKRMRNYIASGQMTKVGSINTKEALPHFINMKANVMKMMDFQVKESLAAAAYGADVTPTYMVLLIAVAALAVSVIVSTFTASYCKRALVMLSDNVGLIEGRDLSQPVHIPMHDEFGELSHSIENLRH